MDYYKKYFKYKSKYLQLKGGGDGAAESDDIKIADYSDDIEINYNQYIFNDEDELDPIYGKFNPIKMNEVDMDNW